MSDIGNMYKDYRTERRDAANHRRLAEWENKKAAHDLAYENGMRLVCVSDIRYRLHCDGWMLDLYPGNQRIYNPNKKRPAPFLKLPLYGWKLIDVINAVIKARAK